MLSVGAIAPDFTGIDCRGRPVRLVDYRGKRVVLFFYPKTFTVLCTAEARAFRDHHEEIRELGAELIGISCDPIETQCRFASEEGIDFPLLADESRQISERYDVLWPQSRRDRRVTFVVGPDGVIEETIHHEVRVWRHLDDVLAHLKKQSGATSGAVTPEPAT